MKKISILLFVFFTTFSLSAQIEWVGDFGFASVTKELYKTRNNQFVVARIGQDDSGFSVLADTGNLIFNYSDSYHLNIDPVEGQGHILRIDDFIEMADSAYLFLFYEQLCYDPSGGDWRFRLVKFDHDWNELVLNAPLIYPSPVSWNQQFLVPLPDSTFYRLASYNLTFEKRNRNGGIIWSKHLPYYLQGSIKDFLPLSGDTTVLVSWDSVHVLDNQGDFIHSYRSPTFENIKKASNGNYYGQKLDTMFALAPTFSVVDHVSFPDRVKDFALMDSALVVLTNANEIYIYDDSLHLQDMFQVDGVYPFGNYPVAHLEALPGSFLVAGQTDYGSDINRSYSPLVKEYPLDGDVVYDTEDIGVTAVEIIGPPSESIPPFGNYQLVYDSLKITVHNFGNNAIDSLKLNAHFPSLSEIGSCVRFYQLHHKKYTGISLMPGQSMDFYWEDFRVAFEEIPAEENFGVCIWSSLPNQKIDWDSENDIFCTDFLVSDGETVQTGFSWSVFPNPVYDYLNVQMEAPQEGCKDCIVRITDISGRERYISIVDGLGQTIRIPVWGWEAGLYFLQYLNDDGVFRTSRFVVMK